MDADTIMKEGISPSFKSMNSSASLLALWADGASVMSGCNDGLAAKLLGVYPCLMCIRCAAHRLYLIVAYYLSKVKTAKVVIETYKAMHKIFNVAKNREKILRRLKCCIIQMRQYGQPLH